MPNLINDQGYNGLGGLAQNYRRVATGGSNYGTRRIQFYQIVVYGLSDAEVAKLDDYRVVNNTEVDIDQEPEREFKQATVAELVVRAIQSVAEVYIVGAHDVDQEESDYNDFYLIIGVSGDTYSSGFEMDTRDDPATRANNNPYLNEALYNVFDNMDAPTNDGFDVYPTFIYGDHFSTITYPNTMSRAERKAASAPARLARKNG
jgi:hypothetical protein